MTEVGEGGNIVRLYYVVFASVACVFVTTGDFKYLYVKCVVQVDTSLGTNRPGLGMFIKNMLYIIIYFANVLKCSSIIIPL